jgi:Ca-activated chloride channel family protein
MKEQFDRHQDRLTDAEDRRVWAALHDEVTARRDRSAWRRWRVPGTALALAATAVVAVALAVRGPADRAMTGRLDRARAEKSLPTAEPPSAMQVRRDDAENTSKGDLSADADRGGHETPTPAVSPPGSPDSQPAERVAEGSGAAKNVGLTAAAGERASATPRAAEEAESGVDVASRREVRPPRPVKPEIARVDDSLPASLRAAKDKGASKGADESAKPQLRVRDLTDNKGGAAPAPASDFAKEAAEPPVPAPAAAGGVSPEARSADRVGTGTIRGHVAGEKGEALQFANVVILGTSMGAVTDSRGEFAIEHVPAGRATIRVSFLGYAAQERTVDVARGGEVRLDFTLVETVVSTMDPVVVGAKKQLIRRESGATLHRVGNGSEQEAAGKDGLGRGFPTAPAPQALESGIIDNMRFAPPGAPKPHPGRWPISVGDTDPVNGQAFDSMFFQHYGVNPFVDPEDDRYATFAVDVDNASYTMARSYLERGELPPPDAIRVEEFVNSFRHDYAPPGRDFMADRAGAPSRHGTFAIHLEAAPSPFGPGLTLMRVGLKGREVDVRDRKPAVLTFVIDVSGSMGREDRLGLAKRALHLLLDQMNPEDEVGIVVYGTNARTILEPTSLRHRERIEWAIDGLRPEGATNAEAGLRRGYAMADRAFRRGAINRVILCSDGVANVGNTGAETILSEIKSEARKGIELTAVGFGMGNYNDVLMEKLADQGDGNYYYVDDIREARRVFVENLTGTLQTIARQVKIQVEFDPGTVRRYRLLGYENRDVADRDFRNDKVDAGEVGAGHEVTALFEVKLEKKPRTRDLATVRIRYEDPETGKVTEEVRGLRLSDVERRLRDTDPTFRLDAAAAEFAEILRHSYWAKDGNLAGVVGLAKEAERQMGGREDVEELVGLTETAWRLWPRGEKPQWRDDVRPLWEPDQDYPQLKRDH